jgi:hypothetical protein
MAKIIDSRYTDWPTWHLGVGFETYQCFSLNFTHNTIGFYAYRPSRTSEVVNNKNPLIKTLSSKIFHQKF